jgi:Ca-activated chloride channel homolog
MINITDILLKRTGSVLITLVLLIALNTTASGQAEKKFVRQGNRAYDKKKFADSEISYRKAADKNKNYPDAVFNAGDALYRQNKFEEAGKQFMQNASMNEDKDKKSAAMFNLGNSMLKANKLQESIEAYKNSLKLNPGNNEAKYNLAYAQDQLKKQQDQKNQQQQQQNKDNKDQDKDKNKQDQKKDQQNKQDQNKENKDNQNEKQKPDQQQQQTMSKDDAERLLNALANEEKKVQEKVKLAKAAKSQVRTVKNW